MTRPPCGCIPGQRACPELKRLQAKAEAAAVAYFNGAGSRDAMMAAESAMMEHALAGGSPHLSGTLTDVKAHAVVGMVFVYVDGFPHVGKLDPVRESIEAARIQIGEPVRLELDPDGEVVAVHRDAGSGNGNGV